MSKKGLILIFSTAIISGFSVYINKYSVSVINPPVFVFLKNALVALLLCGIFLAAKEQRELRNLKKKQWAILVVIGLVGGSAPFLLFFKGLSLTSAAQGGFVHKIMFIFVAILAAIFLKERVKKEFLIGALMLFLGNMILLAKLPISFGRGDGLIFLATFLWATENIISKYALRELSGKIVAWGRMFFGSFFILGYLVFIGQFSLVINLNSQQIAWTAITAGLLLGYVATWYSGLKHIPVSLATAILMLGSTMTTLLSFISGVNISSKEIISSALVLSGLVIILGFGHIIDLLNKLKHARS